MSNASLEITHSDTQTLLRAGLPLNDLQQQAVKAHLAVCRECRAYADFVLYLERALPLAAPSFAPDPQRSHRRIQALEHARRPSRVRGWVHGIGWAGAVLLLVIGLSWSLQRLLPRPPALTETAAAPLQEIGLPKPTEPVLPAVGGRYTYLPQEGFVDLNTTLLLPGPLRQETNGQWVEVLEGAASPAQTSLWITASGPRPLLEGAFLELEDGTRLPLSLWNTASGQEESGPYQLVFPALPIESRTTVLALADGWRFPLAWTESSTLSLPILDVSPPACMETGLAQVCVLAAAQTDAGTHLLLSGSTPIEGLNLNLPLVENIPPDSTEKARLSYESGEALAQIDDAPGDSNHFAANTVETVTFAPLPQGVNTVTLRLPGLLLHHALDSQITLDLGASPQAGSEWAVDLPVSIEGLTVRFTQARLEGDGVSSLRLKLTSDPVEEVDNRLISGLAYSRPEGVEDLFGWGFEWTTRRHIFTFELINQRSAPKTGILTIPLTSAQIALMGPFRINFSLPETTPRVTATTQSIAPDLFTPPPTATPLPLHAFEALRTQVEPGEVLSAVQEGENTRLSASLPGGTLETAAILPGQVFQVFLHPDQKGLDYLTRTSQVEGANLEVSLYSLRMDGSQPEQMLGPLEIVDTALISPDSRFLLLTQRRSLSDPPEPFLLDLNACRLSENCQELLQPLDFRLGDVTLGCPVWAPDQNHLSLCGLDSAGGDVYRLDLSRWPDVPPAENITHTPDYAEGFGGVLLPGDRGLIWICEPNGQINVFGICRSFETGATPQMLTSRSSAPTPLITSPDGRLLAFPDWSAKGGGGEIFVYNLESGEMQSLARVMNFRRMQFSSDSRSLLVLESDGQAFIVSLDDGSQVPLLPQPVVWAGWVP